MDSSWIERFLAAIAEERRNRQLADYRRDSILIQEGKRAEAERIQAFAGYLRYEPEGTVPDGD